MWKKSILLEWNIFSYCLILRLTLRKKSSPDLPKIVIGSWQCLLNPSLGNCLKGIIRRVIFHALISSSSFEKSLKLLFFLLLLKILCRMLSRLWSHKLFFRKICTMDHFLIGLAPLIVSKLDQFQIFFKLIFSWKCSSNYPLFAVLSFTFFSSQRVDECATFLVGKLTVFFSVIFPRGRQQKWAGV